MMFDSKQHKFLDILNRKMFQDLSTKQQDESLIKIWSLLELINCFAFEDRLNQFTKKNNSWAILV